MLAVAGPLLLSLLSDTCEATAGETEERTTLAVMYFTNRGKGEEWDWLRKGFADLLITDLAASDRLLLVERERIQEILKELKVSETGAIDKTTALKAARIARAETALFGSYEVKEGDIEVEAHIIDLATGKLRRIEWVKGRVDEFQKVEKELAEKVAANLDVKLSADEMARLKRLQTDSVDAMTRLYRGLDLYDRGDYPRAFGNFRAAMSKDPAYAHARYWIARMYIAMDEAEHGLLAYQKALKQLPEGPMTARIRFDYARALHDKAKDYKAAVRQYTVLIEASPLLDKSYDELLEKRTALEDAALENEKVQKYFITWNRERSIDSMPVRMALFYRAHCYHELGDLEHAVEDMYGVVAVGPDPLQEQETRGPARRARELLKVWYHDLVSSTDKAVPKPSWVFRFKSEDDVFVAEPPKDPWLGSRLSHEVFNGRVMEAPPGRLFDRIKAKVELLPIEGSGYPYFGLRDWHGAEADVNYHIIRNFDPRELEYSWEKDVIPDTRFLIFEEYSVKRLKRIEITASFKKIKGEGPQEIQPKFSCIQLNLRPEWAESWVNGWKTVHGYAKVYPGTATIKAAAPGYPTKEFDVECPPEGLGLLVSLEDDWTPIVQIAKGLNTPSMIRDRNGLYRLVAVGKPHGVENIYEMISRDALQWSKPRKLPVNCPQEDRSPHLIEAENGTLVLLWASKRGEDEKTVYCVSTSSDGSVWSDPVILRPLRKLKKNHVFTCYSLWQDSDGVFWIQTTEGAFHSRDAREWTWVPPADDKPRSRSWRLPHMANKEAGPRIVYRDPGRAALYGRDAIRELKMRRGESRLIRSHDELNLVMLPDGGLFACGHFGLERGTNTPYENNGLAALTHDGDNWTTTYRHNTGSRACFVWDGGSRIVCVRGQGYYNSSAEGDLVVSFCDIDKLAGRPEETPTRMRSLSPREAAEDPSKVERILGRRFYQFRVREGRIFCTLNTSGDAGLGEIDPVTGAGTVYVESGVKIDFITGPNWCDSDGNYLWVATQKNGLLRLGLNDGQVKWYRTADGLITDNVRSVNCHKGKVYIGTLSGLNILDPATDGITAITKDDGMPDNSIRCVTFQGDIMWLGTVGAGAIMHDTRTGEWTHFPYDHEKIGKGGPDLLSDYISAIFAYGDSVFFMSYGIAEYNIKTREWKHYMRGPFCSAVVRDGHLLWYGSSSDGIFTFNMKTKEVRKHFVRTPSYTRRQSNPNFSHRFDLLGDEALIAHYRNSILVVPKEELMRNSFVYEQWKKVHISIRQDLDEEEREER